MALDFTRGDFLAKRGTAVITNDLTFVGDGGVNVAQAPIKSGTTTLINTTGGLASQDVDGQKIFIPFGQLNITTNLAATVIPPLGGNTTLTEVLMDRAGSLLGVSARLNAAITAGSISIFPTINGTTKLTATLNTTSQATAVTQDRDTDTFAATGRIGIKLTSSADLSPVTGDIIIGVVCEI